MVSILSCTFFLIGFVVFEIRAISGNGIFGCMPMDHANLCCACAVSRDPYVGVKSNPIFGFCIPMFPIHYVTFMELS